MSTARLMILINDRGLLRSTVVGHRARLVADSRSSLADSETSKIAHPFLLPKLTELGKKIAFGPHAYYISHGSLLQEGLFGLKMEID